MSRKESDPLSFIPSPDAIRRRLTQTERLATRLRILLRVSEEIRANGDSENADALDTRKEVSNGR
jgi:hypothetical protein